MKGDTGRGAARVDHHGRAFEVQVVGQSRRDNRVRGPRERFVQIPGRLGPDEHGDALAIQCLGVVPGILQALPPFLHDQALMRIHRMRFTRR